MKPISDSLRSRFESRYAPCPMSGCWLWLGAIGSHGYGAIGKRGDVRLAHRLSWEIHNGPITDGLHVLHRCDNRACVNPAHLFLGTHADNNRDAAAKGRRPKGDKHWNCKVPHSSVQMIIESDLPQSYWAKKFGVNQSTISLIRSGKRR